MKVTIETKFDPGQRIVSKNLRNPMVSVTLLVMSVETKDDSSGLFYRLEDYQFEEWLLDVREVERDYVKWDGPPQPLDRDQVVDQLSAHQQFLILRDVVSCIASGDLIHTAASGNALNPPKWESLDPLKRAMGNCWPEQIKKDAELVDVQSSEE